MTQENKSFIQRVSEYKAAIHADGLKKTGKNRSFDYFDMPDFIPSAMRLAPEFGLLTLTSIGREDSVLYVFDAKSEEKLSVIIPTVAAANTSVPAIQNHGSTITYMRRYLWITFLDLAEHDAIDAGDYDEGKTPKGRKPVDEKTKSEAPKTEAPKTDAKQEQPKTEAPKTEAPKTEAPKAQTTAPATPAADNYRKHFVKQINESGRNLGEISKQVSTTYKNANGTGKKITELTIEEMKELLEFLGLKP